jgi:hypothetical protein
VNSRAGFFENNKPKIKTIMKRHAILSGAVAAIALCAMDASAQFNYQNGDMLAAFGNGGATDVIVDLGPISKFQTFSLSTTYTWNLNYLLTSQFGSVSSSIYWSVFGVNDTSIGGNGSVTQTDANTMWNTLARSNPANKTTTPFVGGSSASQQLPVGDIETIGNLTSPNQASPGMIVDYAPGIELVGTSLGGYSPMMNNPYNGNFQGDWTYNVLNHGVGVSDLYQSDPGNHFSQRATYLGNFDLSSGGSLTFNAVPEPSTWAMIGTGLLTFLAIRRRQ